MRQLRLTNAVKMDSPFLLVGDAGDILTLDEPAADWAVRQSLGVYHGESFAKPPTRAELEAEEAELIKRGGIQTLDEAEAAEGHAPPAEKAEPPKRPYGNAPKSAWVRYAVAVDDEMSEERAEGMTKGDLMAKYGSRLGDED